MKPPALLIAVAGSLFLSGCLATIPKVSTTRLEQNIKRQGETLGQAQTKTETLEEKLARIEQLANAR